MSWRERKPKLLAQEPPRHVGKSYIEEIMRQQAESRLHRPIRGLEVTQISVDESAELLQHQIDVAKYLTEARRAEQQAQSAAMKQALAGMNWSRPKTAEEKLAEFNNADFVMEMLRRGFAVVKCAEPGEMPESLKR